MIKLPERFWADPKEVQPHPDAFGDPDIFDLICATSNPAYKGPDFVEFVRAPQAPDLGTKAAKATADWLDFQDASSPADYDPDKSRELFDAMEAAIAAWKESQNVQA